MPSSCFVALFVFAALAAAPTAAGAQAADRAAGVRRAVEASNAEFVAAMKRGDAAALAALYTEDAIVLPPNSDMIRGRAAIRKFFADFLGSTKVTAAEITTQEVFVSGATAYEVGTNRLAMQAAGQPAVTDRGKYLVVWQRGPDGRWRVHRDMFNTSLPPPSGK